MVIHEIVEERLYQSGVPRTPDDWIAVQQVGCDAEIVLQPEQEDGPGVVLAPDAANRVLTLWAPIIDGAPEPTMEWMILVSSVGAAFVAAGRKLLVRCQGGISRSSFVVCLILMRHDGMTADQALAHLRKRNLFANPNDLFVQSLHDFEEYLELCESDACGCGGGCGGACKCQ